MTAYGMPLSVGPERGSSEWWSGGDPTSPWVGTSEGCTLDDYVQFGSDGTFRMMLGDYTVLSDQSTNTDYCYTPTAPYLSGDYGYEIDTVQVSDTTFYNSGDTTDTDGDSSNYDINITNEVVLKLIGSGAYLGLSKVNNLAEYSIQDTREYYISEYSEEIGVMVVDIYSSVHKEWWRFVYNRVQSSNEGNLNTTTQSGGGYNDFLWTSGGADTPAEDYGEWYYGNFNDLANDRRRYILEVPEVRYDSLNDYHRVGTYNGNTYYQSFTEYNWEEARQVAESKGGYLLVINDQDEYNWLSNNIDNNQYWNGYLVGFYQDKNSSDYSEPNGGWRWLEAGLNNSSNNDGSNLTTEKYNLTSCRRNIQNGILICYR